LPARGIQHVDLAVGDVERSLAFYYEVLGPLGLKERYRLSTYRGTEDVVYLEYGVQGLGLRPADGGEYRYYNVGIEQLAFEVDRPDEVDEAYRRLHLRQRRDPVAARAALRRRWRGLLRLLRF
jgi:catechol 2,3-dioxygenase-like lactoylglutathione lyase family enzyme